MIANEASVRDAGATQEGQTNAARELNSIIMI